MRHRRRLVHANNPRDAAYFQVTDRQIFLYLPGSSDSHRAMLGAFGDKKWHILSMQGNMVTISTTPPEESLLRLKGARALPHTQATGNISAHRVGWGRSQLVTYPQRLVVRAWDHDPEGDVICLEVASIIERTDTFIRPPVPPTVARIKSFSDLPRDLFEASQVAEKAPAVTPAPLPIKVPTTELPALNAAVLARQEAAKQIAAALKVLNSYREQYKQRLQYRIQEDGTVAGAFVREIK